MLPRIQIRYLKSNEVNLEIYFKLSKKRPSEITSQGRFNVVPPLF